MSAALRLAAQTPTGAILWELVARQKILYRIQGLALLVSAVVVHWPGTAPFHDDLVPFAVQLAALAISQTLGGFCYPEVDARRAQGGIPSHLFLKPVTTTRLVATPMLGGGAAVLVVLIAWVALVLRPLDLPTTHLVWVGTVLLSFTWWVQAVVWSSANLAWGAQLALVMLTAGGHLALALLPLMPWTLPANGRIALIVVLLAAAFTLARAGAGGVRQGAWQSWQSRGRHNSARLRSSGRPFASAFGAQFWLEWRRQGFKLTLFTGIGAAFFLLMHIAIWTTLWLHGATLAQSDLQIDISRIFLNFLVLTPLVCSVMLGSLVATFEPGQPGSVVPVFVAIRPLSTGRLVLAKLAMTAASSLLAWLVAGAAFLVSWLLGATSPSFWLGPAIQPKTTFLRLLGVGALLVVFTWRNLVAGMWIGLGGRSLRIRGVLEGVRYLVWLGVLAQVARALAETGYATNLLVWLPWILGAGLLVKVLGSMGVFHLAVRRKVMQRRDARGIVFGWLVGGAALAWLSWGVCLSLGAPQAWTAAVLAGFFLLPLAELALAPLALASNRHS